MKGFVYTIFVMALVLSLVSLASFDFLKSKELAIKEDASYRVDGAYYFLEGARQDLSRSSFISGKRAILAIIDEILDSGNYTTSYADDGIVEAVVNGTYNGTPIGLMEGTTLGDWSSQLVSLASTLRFNATITIGNASLLLFDAFNVLLSSNINVVVRDEKLNLGFNRSFVASSVVPLENIEDPLLSIESYAYVRNIVVECNKSRYPYHASRLVSGTLYSSGWTSGRAYVGSSSDYSSVPDREEKVLVVPDIPDPFPPGISDFAGVVSENSTDDNSSLSYYVFGASNAMQLIGNGTLLVLDGKDVWVNNILDEMNDSCYFEDPFGPSFLDRMEGRFSTSARYNLTDKIAGIGTFLDVSRLPPALQNYYPAVDFVYFNYSGQPVYKIKGVTEKSEGIPLKPWFRLEQQHIDYFNISGLAY